MGRKVCKTCAEEKELTEFYSTTRHGKRKISIYYGIECKICHKKRSSKRVKSHPEQNRLSTRKWRAENPEKQKISIKSWKERNQKKLRIYQENYVKERAVRDPSFKLRGALRRRLKMALKINSKVGSAVRDLGCSIDQLRIYLESKFQPGMSWKNHGVKGWHIDHIRPLASFDLTDRKQFLEACHFSNLQPLWASENLAKSARFPL